MAAPMDTGEGKILACSWLVHGQWMDANTVQ